MNKKTGIPFFGKVFSFIALYILWAMASEQKNNMDPTIFLLLPVYGIAYLLASFLNIGHKSKIQVERDILARDIFLGVLRGEKHKFFLYLRPFKVTNNQLYGLFLFDPTIKTDFEEKLTNFLIDKGLLIGLGTQFEAIGAGRVNTTEEEWREQILKCMKAASCIFLIPSHQPGTFWEIEQIVKLNFLSKTIFITPYLGSYTANDWYQIKRLLLDKFGFDIPNFSKGLMFTLDEKGNHYKLPIASNLFNELSTKETDAFFKKLSLIMASQPITER